MGKSVTVLFDGDVLRPDHPLDLEPNTRYQITIGPIEPEPNGSSENAWQVLSDLAGTVDAPPDWASEHDHYLYGTPKYRTN